MNGTSTSPSTYKGPTGPLVHRCPQCSARGPGLFRCSGCRAVRYCSRDHQVAHRPQHKTACTKIRKARVKVAEEDDRIRNATPDDMTPANAFETEAGRFWGVHSTRDYMRARFALARERLLQQGTLDGVSEALEHMQDMLRLCRGDNMSLRKSVPAMMLRLDLDQECYDFIKWWAIYQSDNDHNFDDVTIPYLDIRGADVLENPDFMDQYLSLIHFIAMVLLKFKLLIDIRNIKVTRKVLSSWRMPYDICELIKPHVVRSPLSTRFQNASPKLLAETETKLVAQILHLTNILTQANHSFVFQLFEPDEALSRKPDEYSLGSWEEMALASTPHGGRRKAY